jgi:imidazolonepropionase-like amidohydrolase
MPPECVLSALTRVGARILGKANQLGTVEPAKLADIIVVKGNPLFDIVALSNVEVVIKDGVVYKGGPDVNPRTAAAKGAQ